MIIFAENMTEEGNRLHLIFSDGTTKTFDAVQLAGMWLRMSNDAFYNIYGFNYVPSQKIQSKARAKEAGA